MKEEFHSLDDLYKRVYPALLARKNELKRSGYLIETKNIWDYLSQVKWKNSKNLMLSDIVNDIMKVEYDEIISEEVK